MVKKSYIGVTIDQEVMKYIVDKNKETLVNKSVIVNELLKKAINNESKKKNS